MLRAELRGAGPIGAAATLGADPGQCVALTGPSGAGKTTLLRALAGLERAAGRVECGGETWLDTAAGVDVPAERRRVGMVFQDHALFGHMTARGNVEYALGDRPRGARRGEALELLGRLGLAERAEARPAKLSGGERQRVAVARALARRPAVLLLDEPLSSLDARTRATAALELARTLREYEVPAVLVTHDFTEAAQFAGHVVVLDEGRVAQAGTASELAAEPASAFVADLTGAVVLTATAHGTRLELEGGGTIESVDSAQGPVAAIVQPWDIALHESADIAGSPRNRIAGRVTTVTVLGGRARVAMDGPQTIVAEVAADTVERLGLVPGRGVVAVWKATATRVVPR